MSWSFLRKANRRFRSIDVYDRLYRKLSGQPPGEDGGEDMPKKGGPGGGPAKQRDPAVVFHDLYGRTEVIENQAMFDSFWGRTIGCNPYAVYLQMRADPQFEGFTYIWACNDPETAPEDMQDDPSVWLIPYGSEEYARGLATSKYLVANSNLPPFFLTKPDQVYVNLWHGTPIKHIGADAEKTKIAISNTQRNYFQSNVILSYSPVATERTVDAHLAQDARSRVHEIGTPRIDLTLKASREEVRETLGVTSDRPVLLYAPTWRGKFGNISDDLASQMAQIRMIEKQFSKTYEIFISAHNITEEKLRQTRFKFRSVPKDIPINEVLAGVDVLVSDYSSIVVDFLVLDRPIVLYCYDYGSFSVDQGFYFDLKEFPAAFCENQKSLETALGAPRKPSEFETFERFHSELCPLEDGKASERAVAFLADVPPTPERTDDRTRIVMYPGGMMTNGVTSSIIALSNQLDYDRYDLTLVITASEIDNEVQRQANIARLHPKCRIIYRGGITNYAPMERPAYNYFIKNASYGRVGDELLVGASFSREARRIFGQQTFDVAIDFSGYGPFWSEVMLYGPAPRKLIYQHNDMHGEAFNSNEARNFAALPAVFQLYKSFDGIVSVTPAMLEDNKEKLSDYYRDTTELFSAQNVISGEDILQKSKVPLILTSPQVAAIRAEEDMHLFCCVARLSPEKNHSLLLEAYAKVLKAHQRSALLLLGDGALREELELLAVKLGIADHVIFLGVVDNPYPVMAACDTKVLSSTYEGQGIVLLEALTLGLNCIATDNPAVRNVLDGGYGTLVPPTAEALSQAMLDAINGSKDAAGAEGPHFEWADYTSRAMAEFERAVDGRS